MIPIEDKIEIQELLARFAHFSDYGNWAELEKLFLPDVVTETGGMGMAYSGIGPQIEHAKESDRQTGGKNRHLYYNVYIEEDGPDIFVNYYVTNVNAGAAPMAAQIVVTGRHRDKVVKTAEGWKFAHRLVTFDQSFSLDF